MIKFIIKILLLFLSLHAILFAEDLQSLLTTDMDDGKLEDFSRIEAAFVLSGVHSQDSLQFYVQWYEDIVQQMASYHFDRTKVDETAQKIFAILHSNIIGEYERESTTLLDIVHRKKFNCVSSTILYNLICDEFGLQTLAYETPTHVYTIFSNFDHKFIVENTSPMGFDMLNNLQAYSQFLVQYFPENRNLNIGLDRLYAWEYRNGREIDNTELLGLLAYNQAYFAAQKYEYEKAYDFVLVAQRFNADSPSNYNFEQNLYYKWGKKCYDEGRFYDAFTVFADGFYRYPDIGDFRRNTRVTFFNALNVFWQTKNWRQTVQITHEILALDALETNDVEQLKIILNRWRQRIRGERKTELEQLLQKIE